MRESYLAEQSHLGGNARPRSGRGGLRNGNQRARTRGAGQTPESTRINNRWVQTYRSSRIALPGVVLESLEVLEGVEGGGVVEIDFEEGLAEVVVLGGEHLQLGFGRRRGRGGAAGQGEGSE